jgi:hypothetical protein
MMEELQSVLEGGENHKCPLEDHYTLQQPHSLITHRFDSSPINLIFILEQLVIKFHQIKPQKKDPEKKMSMSQAVRQLTQFQETFLILILWLFLGCIAFKFLVELSQT